ncbi:uncharacterized protein LOC116772706 [Danaus plexippus]|uniref:uncharacterized protein LOC116772706 n=1 Tax=Danaus plexippus TaxID=13037 RepID=UPI002AB0B797|nr:uncharacterized protein LOC116772706 [Danaus plexippus]
MEAVEEVSASDAAPCVTKSEDSDVVAKDSNEVCTSNGVESAGKNEEAHSDVNNTEKISSDTVNDLEAKANDIHCNDILVSESIPPMEHDVEVEEVHNKDIVIQENIEEVETVETVVTEVIVDDTEAESEPSKQEVVSEAVEEVVIPTNSEEVKFETEILIEENDFNENVLTNNEEIDSSTYILNDLAPNIELSEVLRSSDVADNSENNNSTDKQEVFNKEELLDILEGNDINEENDNTEPLKSNSNKLSEAEIALKQLSKLKRRRNKTKVVEKVSKANAVNNKSHKVETEVVSENKPQQDDQKKNIVKVLVMDWEDEETGEGHQPNNIVEESEALLKDTEDVKISQDEVINQTGNDDQVTQDSSMAEDALQSSDKNEEIPPRRLSRVIKKKVIFDPDNPDTFTKGKTPVKSKEIFCNKDQTPSKKLKPDPNIQRSKSKSPLSKLQWKKPSPKNNKQNKRLSEVDKLLMDEGAVNMIYQLTPEATKGKKNMKTKAEFIKKLQSSTPEGKEMKFRERKKEFIKYEDGEPKRILSGKQRASLSSSVKSPASEDFETHSADDSIIYRRHSSSSYSSSCMSPRRLSDVEGGSTNSNTRLSQQSTSTESPADIKTNSNVEHEGQPPRDMFNPESDNTPASEIINKSDCLSIKEKLNSKLSLALNKRKREASKSEKPAKQKKIVKTAEQRDNVLVVPKEEIDKFNFVSITLDQRLAVINVQNTGDKIGVEVLKELEMALNYIDKRKDISITMFSSHCGTVCSLLDLALLVNENKEIRVHHATELAETIKGLLSSAARHSKLVWCGVAGACSGLSLSLAALSDVSVAAEDAIFALTGAGSSPLLPGAAVLTSRCQLSQALVNDLFIFGRRLTASEAVAGGLISRTLYPDRLDEQMLNIAKDVAAQPVQNVLLKKRLLNLRNNNTAEGAFLSSLESERELFVEHWTSVEGQESLRAGLDAA